MNQRKMRYSNEEATNSGVKAIYGLQSRQVIYCGTSKLQFRQELAAVSQGDGVLALVSLIPLRRSIAHCSNCSSEISAVGGVS